MTHLEPDRRRSRDRHVGCDRAGIVEVEPRRQRSEHIEHPEFRVANGP